MGMEMKETVTVTQVKWTLMIYLTKIIVGRHDNRQLLKLHARLLLTSIGC